MTNEERSALVAEKVGKLRKELEELGVASSFFYRTPGSAKAPLAYLLIGETAADVEEARSDRRL
ncbi:hypothetical protein [Paraburkholderia hospita]|uniref:hypothetical protein n=1 Tax=Paraburkholderia hospita TaxID=169430 RepID=UPI0002717913|nr:hypothetical protein [Paraburkholderia hospita]EUC20759.1 hypothetical protein PMI06_009811 [Burkholderia sp. BT03]SKD08427.1 hypothetical protein SAMN06266956_10341 [Paraburkholderia hospita]